MRLLVLTRLFERYQKLPFFNTEEFIFLGPWCLPKGKIKTKHEIIKNNWCSTIQRKKDFEEIWKLKNEVLKEIKPILNKIHKINLNQSQWDLILGYWLYYIITISYDRLSRIKNASKKIDYFISEKIYRKNSSLYFSNSDDSINAYRTDEWNSLFIENIIKELNLLKTSVQNDQNISFLKKDFEDNSYKKYIKFTKDYSLFLFIKVLEFLLMILSGLRSKKKIFFIYKPTINFFDFFKILFFIKGQVKLLLPPINYEYKKSLEKHRNLKINLNNINSPLMNNDLKKVLSNFIFKTIPKSYLENFSSIYASSYKYRIEKRAITVFSAGAEINDDEFKIFAASIMKENSKLIFGQHGSGPFASYLGCEKYRLDLANIYFSTGDGNCKISNKVKDAGQFWARYPKYVSHKSRNNILFITTTNSRYTNELRSMADGDYMISYLANQREFIENISNDLFGNLLLRLDPLEFGWHNKLFLKSFFPKLRVSGSDEKLNNLLFNTSLLISDYNATTYNESIAAGYPTIIFWDNNIWSSHLTSQPIFKLLKEVNIFFDSPKDAAIFASSIYGNIHKWWNSEDVIYARKKYCEAYANLENKNNKFIDLINEDS